MLSVHTELKFLTGVGAARAQKLIEHLRLRTVADLLGYYPFRYIDRSKFHLISELNDPSTYIQIKGYFIAFRNEGAGKAKRIVGTFKDESGTVDVIWFGNQSWVTESYKLKKEYIVFGKPNQFKNTISFPHPEIEDPLVVKSRLEQGLQGIYRIPDSLKDKAINTRYIRNLVFQVLGVEINDYLPESVIKELGLLPLQQAIRTIHFPSDDLLFRRAQFRLKFDELFLIQLYLVQNKGLRKVEWKGHVFSVVGEYFNHFYNHLLPFPLTEAQKRVIREMRKDMGTGKHMNRLLQGDVGSGKTLVALLLMLLANDNGFQACLMAPTEILATQHYQTITQMLSGMPLKIALLTGSTRKKVRTEIHEDLQSGALHILIGTHALLEDVVVFKNLALVVIDEQHRFGVAQRARLWAKSVIPPHVVVMTATPIPRTLALTLYGDLDISVLDELPPGRKPVVTTHMYDHQRLRLFKFLRDEIAKGRQVYIVYPLIKESEKLDIKHLEDGIESITRAFPPPQYASSVLHGQMKPDDKNRNMELFVKGQTHIMVATTVIEVGVNVPNASVMVIENAERFGLSQLHQLRGRVGRGAEQSYCVLMTTVKLTSDGRKRIQTMCETQDGFRIAEVDMQLRGPGDMDGTQQSGMPFDLKIANLAEDGIILQKARDMADALVKDDPLLEKPELSALAETMRNYKNRESNWSLIS